MVHACSELILDSDPTIVVSARTMDFAVDIKAEFVVVPRGNPWNSNAPSGQRGVSWTNKYGFIGINNRIKNSSDLLKLLKFEDGLNEKGLSAALLWFQGFADYPVPTDPATALSIQDLASWILGNFETTDEVKQGLGSVTVWGEPSEDIGNIPPPFHLTVHDAKQNTIVVEWTNKEMKIYSQNEVVGVFTNSPSYDQHVANLENYKTLTCENGSDHLNGSGLLGLPGDSTPKSRFVRLYMLRKCADKPNPNNPLQGVQQALHIMNRVEVVPGEIQDKPPIGNDYTQWTIIRDHQNLRLYFKSTLNQSLRMIDLKEIDFSEEEPERFLPVESDPTFTSNRYSPAENVTVQIDSPVASKSINGLTLSLVTRVSAADIGKHGKMFIFAKLPTGEWRVWKGKKWVNWSGGSLPAYYDGRLETRTVEVFKGEDVSNLKDTKIYTGYGFNEVDMFLNDKYALAYVIE